MTLASRLGQRGSASPAVLRSCAIRVGAAARAGKVRRVASTAEFPPISIGSACPKPSSGRSCARLFAEALPRAPALHAVPADLGRDRRTGTWRCRGRAGSRRPGRRQYGGMGLPPDKLHRLHRGERSLGRRAPARPGARHGRADADAIRHRRSSAAFLPKILSGEQCGARATRSRTRAPTSRRCGPRRCADGDHFIVNGQKIWTTLAHGRDPHLPARAHRQDGEEAGGHQLPAGRPDDAGHHGAARSATSRASDEFCEVFFDNVRVPRENLVGELNQGWTIAKALLGFERLFIGSPKHVAVRAAPGREAGAPRGLFDDAAFVARFAELQLDTADLGARYAGFAATWSSAASRSRRASRC